MTTEPSDGANNSENLGNVVDDTTLVQIRDRLFQHQQVLKQHDFNIMNTSERLTLVVIKTISSVFSLTILVTVLAVVSGLLPLMEALSYIEDLTIQLGAFIMFLIGFITAVQWVIDGMESLRKLFEGPPEIPDDVDGESSE